MDRINSKLNIAKEEISEFEDHGKRNHLKWNLKKKKNWNKSEQLWDNFRQTNLSGIGVSKEEKGETLKKYFLKVTGNFPI